MGFLKRETHFGYQKIKIKIKFQVASHASVLGVEVYNTVTVTELEATLEII